MNHLTELTSQLIAEAVLDEENARYEEYEANTTAELDAYLDKQLALQAELTKMRVETIYVTEDAFDMTEEEFKS